MRSALKRNVHDAEVRKPLIATPGDYLYYALFKEHLRLLNMTWGLLPTKDYLRMAESDVREALRYMQGAWGRRLEAERVQRVLKRRESQRQGRPDAKKGK